MLQWRSESEALRSKPGGFVRRADSGPLELVSLMGVCMRFEPGAEVFGEDEPADYVYKVVSGAIRLSKLMSDGRRQIGAFYLPGDMFGLDAEGAHSFSAEAISASQVQVAKRGALMTEAMRDGEAVRQLWSETLKHLQRAQSHMLLLGRKNAQERLATFLLEMSERLGATASIELPMSRQDIADYLGLTIETVSRTLTQLERDEIIAIPASRRIVLRNRHALHALDDHWADQAAGEARWKHA